MKLTGENKIFLVCLNLLRLLKHGGALSFDVNLIMKPWTLSIEQKDLVSLKNLRRKYAIPETLRRIDDVRYYIK